MMPVHAIEWVKLYFAASNNYRFLLVSDKQCYFMRQQEPTEAVFKQRKVRNFYSH